MASRTKPGNIPPAMDPAAPANAQALPPGTRLEEFEVERVLGAGGFGITYLARDVSLGRQVVIKENLPVQFAFRDTHSMTVSPRHTTGEDADNFAWSLENFANEAALLASLDHPGIVKVLRSFRAHGTAFFVMPYVDGLPLDELIRMRTEKEQSFTADELTGLLEYVLDALAYLHDRGIYHRDIKPGNILITNEGIPVLIDFGSARQRLSERSMTVVESPGYTPFEQLQSRGNVGPWSDLYALGATLARAMTREQLPKAMDRMRNDPFRPLASRESLRSIYPIPLLTSIDKALSVEEGNRWQEAREWLSALARNAIPHVSPRVSPPHIPNFQIEVGGNIPKPAAVTHGSKGKGKQIAIIAVGAICFLVGAIAWATHHAKTNGQAEIVQQERIEAERQAERDQQARLEAEQKARATAERDAQAEAARQAEAERLARVEVERLEALERQSRTGPLSFGEIRKRHSYYIDGVETIVIKYVPGGQFQMGSPSTEADRSYDENQVSRTLSRHYWMGETEVTQGQWQAVMGNNPSYFEGTDWKRLPVENVSWEDAQALIAKLNETHPPGDGWKWALPTEAQWERACRGGTTTATAFGNSLSSNQANFNGDHPYGGAERGANLRRTVPVKSYQPNAYGLYDMHGNVWEWCEDGYQERLPGGVDPLVSTGQSRVIRGGGWYDRGGDCRSANRLRGSPDIRSVLYGFRLAVVPLQ